MYGPRADFALTVAQRSLQCRDLEQVLPSQLLRIINVVSYGRMRTSELLKAGNIKISNAGVLLHCIVLHMFIVPYRIPLRPILLNYAEGLLCCIYVYLYCQLTASISKSSLSLLPKSKVRSAFFSLDSVVAFLRVILLSMNAIFDL